MKALVLGLLLASSSAFAMTETNQTVLPMGGQFDLSVGAIYGTITSKAEGYSSSTLTETHVPISFQYGFADKQAVGVDLGYSSYSTTGSDSKGLNNMFVGYRGNIDMGAPTLFVKTGLNVPLEKQKKEANANGDMTANSSTGQLGIDVLAGLNATTTFAKFGGAIEYVANQEGDQEYKTGGNTYSGKIKDGSTLGLAVWAEVDNAYHPNLQISMNRQYTRHVTYDDVASTTLTSTGYDTASVQANLRWAMATNVELMPVAAYTTLLNKSDLHVDQFDGFSIGCGLRTLF